MISKVTIYLEPTDLKTNSYYNNMIRLIKFCGYRTEPADLYWNKKWNEKPQRQIFIFSWQEDKVARDTLICTVREFLIIIRNILQIKLKKSHLIWIRHNYKPHKLNSSHIVAKALHPILLFFLNLVSTAKIVHSEAFALKKKGYIFVPHPPYDFKHRNAETRDIPYFIFGKIMRYKGILEVLAAWPQNQRLLISGQPENEGSKNEILEVIESRQLSVTFEPRFLEIDELDDRLRRTQCVISAGIDKSMIVSGVVFHALSYGCCVMARKSEYIEELKNQNYPVISFGTEKEIYNLIDRFEFEKVIKKNIAYDKHEQEQIILEKFFKIFKRCR